jgi:hypothetical protein
LINACKEELSAKIAELDQLLASPASEEITDGTTKNEEEYDVKVQELRDRVKALEADLEALTRLHLSKSGSGGGGGGMKVEDAGADSAQMCGGSGASNEDEEGEYALPPVPCGSSRGAKYTHFALENDANNPPAAPAEDVAAAATTSAAAVAGTGTGTVTASTPVRPLSCRKGHSNSVFVDFGEVYGEGECEDDQAGFEKENSMLGSADYLQGGENSPTPSAYSAYSGTGVGAGAGAGGAATPGSVAGRIAELEVPAEQAQRAIGTTSAAGAGAVADASSNGNKKNNRNSKKGKGKRKGPHTVEPSLVDVYSGAQKGHQYYQRSPVADSHATVSDSEEEEGEVSPSKPGNA